MGKRRNDLEIMNWIPQIALHIQNSDQSPLYDVRNPAGTVCEDYACEVMFRGRCFEAPCSRHCIDLRIPSGGARRDRTDDLMLAKHALSQLSYGPVSEDECCLPARETHALDQWWAWEDLNFRPHAYQARALTN
jgi:hypothetical protein